MTLKKDVPGVGAAGTLDDLRIRGEKPAPAPVPVDPRPREFGGPPGPDPTRYGDWEKGGRCVDF